MPLSCVGVPRTAVNQSPSAGSVYPFLHDHELKCLFLDLRLDYIDTICPPPGEAPKGILPTPAASGYAFPFCITEVSGFSSEPFWEDIADLWEAWTTPWGLGGGLQSGDARITISDADGTVVFDTEGATLVVSAWGVDRTVLQWSKPSQGVLKAVVLTNEVPSSTTYAAGEVPLDPTTYHRRPLRVETLSGGGNPTQGVIELVAGYNLRIDVADGGTADGGRRRTRLVLNAVPGAGLGRFSDCGDEVSPIRRINDAGPNKGGNVRLESDDCFRIQPAVTVAGTLASFGGHGLTSDQAEHALGLDQSCGPTCPDDYYRRVYMGVYRMWNRWKLVAEDAEAVRDLYRGFGDRWEAQRQCRIGNAAKVVVFAEKGKKLTIGGVWCNMTGVCITPLEMRFLVEVYDRDTPVAAAGELCSSAAIKGSPTDGSESYAMAGSWPQYYAELAYASSQDTSSVRFRVCVPEADAATFSARVTMTIHGPDIEGADNWPDLGPGGDYGSDYPIRAIAIKTTPFDVEPPQYGCEC